MKKYILPLSLVAMIFTACSKDSSFPKSLNSNEKNTHATTVTDDLPDYHNVGHLHNSGLDFLLTTNDLDTNSSNSEIIQSFTSRLFPFMRNSGLYSSFTGDSLLNVQTLSTALENEEYGNASETLNTSIDLVEESVSPRELYYLNTCNSYFETADTLNASTDEKYEWLSSNISTLINQYNNEQWDSGSGDLAGGYLYTAQYSTNFWFDQNNYDNFPPLYERDTVHAQFLLIILGALADAAIEIAQIDAAGYAYGWGKAYHDGVKNPDDRISAGKSTAVEWSTCFAVGKAISK